MRIQTLFYLLFSGAAFGIPDVSQWNEPRNFHLPFEQEFERNVRISEEEKVSLPKLATFSENGVYWYKLKSESKENSTQQIILSGKTAMTITLEETYPNFPLKVEWINEKLVFIRVWWGRSVGTDMIFDVEKMKFLSREMVYDGTQLYYQTQQSFRVSDSGVD